ncbi:methyl-accepting chemotaxis protein [bacterium]|nr:methyl-accepting chemotaxis protein [bacterium]
MLNEKLRIKITVGASLLVLLIMMLSTIVVSFIIYSQNRETSFARLEQSITLVRDDLLNISINLLNHTQQIANMGTLASTIDFLKMTDSSKELDGSGKDTYREIAASIYTITRTANLSKTAVYTNDGNMICFVLMEDGEATIGYPLKSGFDVIKLKTNENIQADMWKTLSDNDIIEKKYGLPMPTAEKTQFVEQTGKLTVLASVPIMASVYDEKTEQLKNSQIGFVIAANFISMGFVSRLQKLTGVDVNIFNKKQLTSGSNLKHNTMVIDQFKSDVDNWSILDQEVFQSDIEIAGETYFQVVVPVFANKQVISAIAVFISSNEAMKNTWQIIKILCFVSLLSIVVVLPLSLFLSNRIAKPLETLSKTMLIVKESGNFSKRVPVVSMDETGIISQSFNDLMEAFQLIIEQINHTMASVANEDLTQSIEGNFKGEIHEVQKNTNESISILSQIIDRVLNASTKVHLGSAELNRSSQALASATTEQAATLEEISSSMDEIGSQSKINSEKANKAKVITEETIAIVKDGNEQMQHMLLSMKQINETSNEVSKIIKVIDEIAFQTNLLALNAAVEAARAGKFGKGFAVVAEEVRNLAARSAEAAKNTTSLIESSLKEVDRGVLNADKTADILTKISSGIERSNELVQEISSASNEQVSVVVEINEGLAQVNNVIQHNSSISEQSASASMELSELASSLKKQLSRFRIKKQTLLLESGE